MIEPRSLHEFLGMQVGRYRLEQLVEQNTLEMSFGARTRTGNTNYLLRILTTASELMPEDRLLYLGHFQREASKIALLQHPHILPLVEYGIHNAHLEQAGGMPFLVWPRLPMKAIRTKLTETGPLDLMTASRFLDQIAAALEYAHQHAVLHRNLTADSMYLRDSKNLVVADVGLLRILELSKQSSEEYALYTSEAITPEGVRGENTDTYADIYLMGALLYWFLTGHRVFRGQTYDEIVQQHLHAPVPSIVQWRRDVPADIDSIIAQAMAKDPRRRFRWPSELANAYHAIVAPNDPHRPLLFNTDTSPRLSQVVPDSKETSLLSKSGQWEAEAARKNTQKSLLVQRAKAKRERISRRRALKLLASTGGASILVAAALIGGHFIMEGAATPQTNTPHTKPLPPNALARATDIPQNSAQRIILPTSKQPGVLVHLPDNSFVAFNSICPHAGCVVQYNGQSKLLECPCHGATFDPARNAAVVQGPATTPLAPVAIKVQADGIIM